MSSVLFATYSMTLRAYAPWSRIKPRGLKIDSCVPVFNPLGFLVLRIRLYLSDIRRFVNRVAIVRLLRSESLSFIM